MTSAILATDYDGTLATDGVVDDGIVARLRGLTRQGLRVILVTGRELSSLFNTFAHVDLFELVVAENGAVVYTPATGDVELIAPQAPVALVEALQAAQVPVSVGHSIVATVRPHDGALLAAIGALGLDSHVIYNKRAAMALPVGVNKATGLRAALKALGVPPEQCIAVGDAENDLDFMAACGLAVAVGNALPGVKAVADVVLTSTRGAAVVELAERIVAGTLRPR